MTRRIVLLEGFEPEELLSLDAADLEALVFTGEPLVFRAGTAEILGEFKLTATRLVLDLAHIDGGGEGVLPTLGALAHRFAASKDLQEVEWIVHALTCANPNVKLRRVLERRGFSVQDVPGTGPAYHLVETVKGQPDIAS